MPALDSLDPVVDFNCRASALEERRAVGESINSDPLAANFRGCGPKFVQLVAASQVDDSMTLRLCAKRTTVTPARACRVEGMTRTQLS